MYDSSTGLATCQGNQMGSGRRSEMKIEEPILHWYIMTRRAQTRSHVVFPPWVPSSPGALPPSLCIYASPVALIPCSPQTLFLVVVGTHLPSWSPTGSLSTYCSVVRTSFSTTVRLSSPAKAHSLSNGSYIFFSYSVSFRADHPSSRLASPPAYSIPHFAKLSTTFASIPNASATCSSNSPLRPHSGRQIVHLFFRLAFGHHYLSSGHWAHSIDNWTSSFSIEIVKKRSGEDQGCRHDLPQIPHPSQLAEGQSAAGAQGSIMTFRSSLHMIEKARSPMLMVAHLTFLVAAALVVLFLNAHISHFVHTNTDSFIPIHSFALRNHYRLRVRTITFQSHLPTSFVPLPHSLLNHNYDRSTLCWPLYSTSNAVPYSLILYN